MKIEFQLNIFIERLNNMHRVKWYYIKHGTSQNDPKSSEMSQNHPDYPCFSMFQVTALLTWWENTSNISDKPNKPYMSVNILYITRMISFRYDMIMKIETVG